MKKKILIRADSSNTIGTGHVMRCLTLAQELRKHGASCIFLCRDLPGNLIGRIEGLGFPVKKVSDLTGRDLTSKKTSKTHNAKVSSYQDAIFCEKIALENETDLLILDHYELGLSWEKYLKKSVPRLMVIDDLADRKHHADILLDQTFDTKKSNYEKLVPSNCNLLIGSSFTLIRPSFSKIRHKALERRKSFKGINNLLISMGGLDHTGITLITLKALLDINLDFLPSINIILSRSSPFYDEVVQSSKNYPGKINIFPFVENIERYLHLADVAIGAGGTSAWERCCLGLPSIVMVLADNQRILSENLESAGAINIVKNNKNLPEQLAHELSSLNNDLKYYKEMSNKAASVSDGEGVKRVIKAMEV